MNETVTTARLSSRHDSPQHDNDNDDRWSMFDNNIYNHYDWSESSAQAPPPNENVNEDEAGAAFMEQVLPFIDPDAAGLFDQSQFSEDIMACVPQGPVTDMLPEYLLS